jgi:hypothetical protein
MAGHGATDDSTLWDHPSAMSLFRSTSNFGFCSHPCAFGNVRDAVERVPTGVAMGRCIGWVHAVVGE